MNIKCDCCSCYFYNYIPITRFLIKKTIFFSGKSIGQQIQLCFYTSVMNNNNDDFKENFQKETYNNATNYYYWFAVGFLIYTIFWVWAIRVKLFKSANSNSTQVKKKFFLSIVSKSETKKIALEVRVLCMQQERKALILLL